jgi:[acyl-carrier-protein] S-malonyltransferase
MDAPQIGLLFPGQGAQVVGMGRALYDRSETARNLFARAERVLGYSLAEVCFSGPDTTLNSTEYSQPALFVTSMAAYHVLCQEQPELLARVAGLAGLSLGEYTAVCVGGVLDFESGLDLVQRRGRAMQAAADQVESGMSSVLGVDETKLHQLCATAREPQEVLQLANLLCPGNIAVSGHLTALRRLEPIATAAGAMKVVPLSVAGAFHTPLMMPAVAELTRALSAKPMAPATIPIYSNVDGQPHTDAEEIRQLLGKQVISPVLWEASIRRMLADGITGFMEIGTGRVLRGTLKRIDRKVASDGFGDT